MAEPHAHSQPIQTYGPAPHNRNIWPHNSRATAAPSRLADSFVWRGACTLITTCVSIILSKSAVYSTKRRGPSTDPCGTPEVTSLGDVSSPDRWTDCVRPFMCDSSQLSALSLIPKESDSRCIRMSWSTVSNAADISSSDRSASWPESMALTTSEKTLRSAVSVEWPRLYAD